MTKLISPKMSFPQTRSSTGSGKSSKALGPAPCAPPGTPPGREDAQPDTPHSGRN